MRFPVIAPLMVVNCHRQTVANDDHTTKHSRGDGKTHECASLEIVSHIHVLTLYVPIVTNINFLLTISIHYHEVRLWELRKWSPKRKYFDLLSNSLNSFFKEMYRDQFGEFVWEYWGLKGSFSGCSIKNLKLTKTCLWMIAFVIVSMATKFI